jgi:hypothetical protein
VVEVVRNMEAISSPVHSLRIEAAFINLLL